MRDPQAAVFNKRLKRIHRMNRRGGAFEAYGTLGQSYYSDTSSRRKRRGVKVLLYVVGAVFVGKALLMADLGEAAYQERVAGLAEGTKIEQTAVMLFRVDPFSAALAKVIAPLLG